MYTDEKKQVGALILPYHYRKGMLVKRKKTCKDGIDRFSFYDGRTRPPVTSPLPPPPSGDAHG